MPTNLPLALKAMALGALAALALSLSCAVAVKATNYRDLFAYRRLWLDLNWAIGNLVDFRFPQDPGTGATTDPSEAYRSILLERTAQVGIQPWQFWRSFRPWAFQAHRGPLPLGGFDDPGRAILLARAFRWMNGVSPYLILWVAPLACFPVVAWLVFELAWHRRPVAAAVFAALLAASPFVAETLTLSRNSVGFYLVAALLFLPPTIHAVLSPRPRPIGLIARFAVAGAGLALCAACRSSSLAFAVALALPAVVGARRTRRPRSAILAAALAIVAVAPTLLTRPAERHTSWSPLWEGLGDFDRTKGHTWSDPVAEALVRKEGAPGLWSAESEAILKARVLANVTSDPLWVCGILAKRVAATVTQWKLWPWGPRDGIHMRRRTSENEGFIDKYYGYTTTVDHLGWGENPWELPITLCFVPVGAFLLLPFVARRWLARGAWKSEIWLVALWSASLLLLPVAITTAGGQETEAFALAYFLATAFLLERVAARFRAGSTTRTAAGAST